MNNPSMVRVTQVLFACLAWIACTACASFSEGRLTKRTLAEYEKESRLAAVTYEFTEGGLVAADEDLVVVSTPQAQSPSILQSRVEPILRRVFVESTRQKDPGEWHVDMYYRETERNPAVTYTLAFLFIASLGFIPAYAETDLYLEAKLKHDGETVKQYIYEESISVWLHWFLLPWSFSCDPLERKSELIDNMILNLVHDLAKDLPRPTPAAP